MLDLRPIIADFKQQYNGQVVNRSQCGVQVVASSNKWTPVLIWQMTQQEMNANGVGGQPLCHVGLLDKNGNPFWNGPVQDRSLAIKHGWADMTEAPPNAPFEKSFPEPPGNVVLGWGKYWFEVADPRYPSDRVTGVTLGSPSSPAHHVTLILFMLVDSAVVSPVDPSPPLQLDMILLKEHADGMQESLAQMTQVVTIMTMHLSAMQKILSKGN